jgi:hypothetical protein
MESHQTGSRQPFEGTEKDKGEGGGEGERGSKISYTMYRVDKCWLQNSVEIVQILCWLGHTWREYVGNRLDGRSKHDRMESHAHTGSG